jgi:hypothetical protein
MCKKHEECPYCNFRYVKSENLKRCPKCGMCLGNCD